MELYIHIPFCKKKCRYCSFTSYAEMEPYIETYIRLILKEAEDRLEEADEPITTVYLGGGTPSLLSHLQLTRLIEGVRTIYGLDNVTEFTAEANPGTLTREWADAAVNVGVNRLSIGMQAAQDHVLRLLGRIHSVDEVIESAEIARNAGIKNINFDLMFGVPTQSMQDWMETLNTALSFCPDHISAYGLIPEEGTPLNDDLRSGTLILPEPDLERDMYDAAVRTLNSCGLYQYEISNFAGTNRVCRHNIGYWTQVPYIGLGVSAASMTGMTVSKDGMTYTRRMNPSTMDSYRKMVVAGVFQGETERIQPSDARFETLMLGLRMNNGVSDDVFFRLHGLAVDDCYGSKMKDLLKRNLIVHEDGHWRLTRRGFDIQNSILVELMD